MRNCCREGTVWETWRVWFNIDGQRCSKLQDKGKCSMCSLKYCNWSVMMEGQTQFRSSAREEELFRTYQESFLFV